MAEEFNEADYGQYTTPKGNLRWRRLPPGVLDRRIRDVCVDWLRGEIKADAPFTVAKIRNAVQDKHERPVSDYGVDQALKRWGRIGAAELSEHPFAFVSFTAAASTKGFKQLQAEYDEWAKSNADSVIGSMVDGEPVYEPNTAHPDEYEWSDAEAYEPPA